MHLYCWLRTAWSWFWNGGNYYTDGHEYIIAREGDMEDGGKTGRGKMTCRRCGHQDVSW